MPLDMINRRINKEETLSANTLFGLGEAYELTEPYKQYTTRNGQANMLLY